MTMVIERMTEALNRHDLHAFLGCFGPNYRSEQPAHTHRAFGGKEQVRKNWSGMFESFPDFEAQLLRYTAEEGVVWGEWHWMATGLNMVGVTIMGGKRTASSGRICIWTRSKRMARTLTDHENHNQGRPARRGRTLGGSQLLLACLGARRQLS